MDCVFSDVQMTERPVVQAETREFTQGLQMRQFETLKQQNYHNAVQ